MEGEVRFRVFYYVNFIILNFRGWEPLDPRMDTFSCHKDSTVHLITFFPDWWRRSETFVLNRKVDKEGTFDIQSFRDYRLPHLVKQVDIPQSHQDSRVAFYNVNMLCMYGLKIKLHFGNLFFVLCLILCNLDMVFISIFDRDCLNSWKDIETLIFWYF